MRLTPVDLTRIDNYKNCEENETPLLRVRKNGTDSGMGELPSPKDEGFVLRLKPVRVGLAAGCRDSLLPSGYLGGDSKG